MPHLQGFSNRPYPKGIKYLNNYICTSMSFFNSTPTTHSAISEHLVQTVSSFLNYTVKCVSLVSSCSKFEKSVGACTVVVIGPTKYFGDPSTLEYLFI